MPAITTLTVVQLKELLRARGLTSTGNKEELILRLSHALGSDNIDEAVLNNAVSTEQNALQGQIDELKAMMAQMAESLRIMSQQAQAAEQEPVVEEVNDAMTDVSSIADADERESIHSVPAAKSQYSIKDIADTIPEYDPTDDTSISAEQFVQHVDSVLAVYGFDQKALLLAIYNRMRGAARSWINGHAKIFTKWTNFKDEFIEEFGCEPNEAEINFKMSTATRRQGESVADYCFRMNALGKRYQLSEAAIVKYTRDGLKHNSLQNAIAAIKFTNMKHLRETAQDYLVNAKTTRDEKQNNFNTQNASKWNRGKPSTENATIKKEMECFNCHAYGHISRNCPQPQRKSRCAKCLRTTHKTAECTETQRNVMPNKNVNKIGDFNQTYPEVVKIIEMNGQKMKAFLDSGSSVSLIRVGKIDGAQILLDCHRVLTGFAGGEYIATKKMEALIRIDGNSLPVELLVVPDQSLPEDMLLGRDVLCRQGSRFVMQQNECYIENIHQIASENSMTKQEQNALTELLSKYDGCFAKDMSGLGKCSTEQLKIELTTNQPVNLKPYRIAFSKRKIVADIVQDLLKYNIIRPSTSMYASPVVLIEKKNGEHRLCVDYRSLNKITIKTPFPMPVLEEQFAELAGNVYFTSLDLRMGYHQIRVHEDSIQYTAFITTEGHFEFEGMPFGLVNAPAVFQRVMNRMISEMPRGEAMAYLDDVIIPSKTISEGLDRLTRFLDILMRHGLTFRYDKCQFFQREIEHLGHIINKSGILPGRKKINAIENFKTPESISEVRRFLGLTGFFRKFVQDYALISKPLTLMLKKTEVDNFQWGAEQQRAFRKLIDKLVHSPVLELYNAASYHELHTDACAVGLAAVLLQSSDEKSWRPVMYYSRHCTEAEQRYHSYELEVLAVVEALERFRIYLIGTFFKIITDCNAIASTKEKRELKPRISRWWLKLQEYNFQVLHRPGNRLAHVDAMSRAPVDPPATVEPAGFVYPLNESDWVAAMQQRDERIKTIIGVLTKRIKSPEETKLKREYVMHNQRLYRKNGNENLLVVPKAVRLSLVQHYHDNMGHFAVERTLQRITKYFWFPKMRKLVKAYIKNCIPCCYNKSQRCKPEGELHFEAPIPIPFRVLHVDHLGPFIRSRKGNTHLLIFTDAFSKFCVIKAVRNTKTAPVVNALNEVISYFGLPLKVISDRGTAFTSKVFAKYCNDNQIIHIKTAVRTPRANGQVERANATILNVLRTSNDQKNWDANLAQVQWMLNSQKNATTKYSPNELIFNFNINDVVHNHLVAVMAADSDAQTSEDAAMKRDIALKNIATERERWKVRFDKAHAKPTQYRAGDLVLIRHEPAATGESRKLEPKYKGPYSVKLALGNDRYVITDVPGLQLKAKAFNSVYSSDHIKPLCAEYPELWLNEETDDYESDEEEPDDYESDEEETEDLDVEPPSVRKGRVDNATGEN